MLMGADEDPTPVLACDFDGCEERSKTIPLKEARCGNPADETRIRSTMAMIPHNESSAWNQIRQRLMRLPTTLWELILSLLFFGRVHPSPDSACLSTARFKSLLHCAQEPERACMSWAQRKIDAEHLAAGERGIEKLIWELFQHPGNRSFPAAGGEGGAGICWKCPSPRPRDPAAMGRPSVTGAAEVGRPKQLASASDAI
jgi:hypothetical protein